MGTDILTVYIFLIINLSKQKQKKNQECFSNPFVTNKSDYNNERVFFTAVSCSNII